MHSFKLKPGIGRVYAIQQNIFENATKKKPPYYAENERNEKVQYAVCPACYNPIQIIGLYKKLRNTDRPYGKHYPKAIYRLADYCQQAYDFCPYSAKEQIPPGRYARKEWMTGLEQNIYKTVRSQFDRVIYVLSREIDIHISYAAAESMLRTYVKGEGWQYPWATLNNIPWVFGYLTWSRQLYGQSVLRGSKLHQSLEKCENVKLVPDSYIAGYDKVLGKTKEYLDLAFCIRLHKRECVDDELVETMLLDVTKNAVKQNQEDVFQKVLTVDQRYFLNLISLPENRGQRNEKLLKIAESIMPPLD